MISIGPHGQVMQKIGCRASQPAGISPTRIHWSSLGPHSASSAANADSQRLRFSPLSSMSKPISNVVTGSCRSMKFNPAMNT
ncbi:MAG: hypothetical protein AAGB00_09665 [Planctomycetota bacterium]